MIYPNTEQDIPKHSTRYTQNWVALISNHSGRGGGRNLNCDPLLNPALCQPGSKAPFSMTPFISANATRGVPPTFAAGGRQDQPFHGHQVFLCKSGSKKCRTALARCKAARRSSHISQLLSIYGEVCQWHRAVAAGNHNPTHFGRRWRGGEGRMCKRQRTTDKQDVFRGSVTYGDTCKASESAK